MVVKIDGGGIGPALPSLHGVYLHPTTTWNRQCVFSSWVPSTPSSPPIHCRLCLTMPLSNSSNFGFLITKLGLIGFCLQNLFSRRRYLAVNPPNAYTRSLLYLTLFVNRSLGYWM